METTRRCGRCRHFCNDPATMETTFPGLSAMSSGYGSVKAHDGLCGLHEVYLSHRDTCPEFISPATFGLPHSPGDAMENP